ncbi:MULTISPECIES: malto-oligosyltrehalose trehalohydrolase [unclassified Corynebacterium]|uniref:malto-oligosyltrehalose trehalohydrolase n=1 Tax=unclassified Corynebacterium TaxID=2624378 RepID=UPI001EF23B9C|nr:malto-oligosyltrehalose trehalohydrolase [Corynebacterium sp. ACRPH]MCG7456957.1 malto-oligosyltrehalose trehalohydrolase [Corynebacterium sp. ACRPH]
MYSVWAPLAENVELVLQPAQTSTDTDSGASTGTEQCIPMTREADNWFLADVPATPGDRYGFSVDGSPVFPDPRSKRQPDGIHGLSEVWQIDKPRKQLGRPLRGEVLYELHIGTFTPEGTFDAAIDKLDELKAVGVTAIELMPVQPFGGERNWGYDGVMWHAVTDVYGGPDGLLRLIDAAHDRDLAVVLDVVYNHFGPDGNYTGVFGPYTAGGSTGWGDVVNLQGRDSDEVRTYILEAVRQWTQEFGVDGLRLDAVHALDDTGAVSLIEQIRDAAEPAWIMAESDQNDPVYTEGYKVAQWNDDIHHAIHTVVSGEDHAYYSDFGTVEVLATAFQRVFWHDGRYSSFRGRTHGRPVTDPELWRFVTYTTTHDQTGNRAAGDRPSMNLSVNQQLAKATLVLTSPFTPMLFMGEEWGASTPFAFFVDHENEELNQATREGRMREFARAGWDPKEVPNPAAEETFRNSVLRWTERTEHPHAEVLRGYTDLLEFRRTHRLAEAELLDVRWWADGEEPVSEALAGVNPTVAPVDAGDELAHGRWIELTYQAPESLVKVTVNLADAPHDGLGLDPWEARYRAE